MSSLCHALDYRKAGSRFGSTLSIATIRHLLADDVKNLQRMVLPTTLTNQHKNQTTSTSSYQLTSVSSSDTVNTYELTDIFDGKEGIEEEKGSPDNFPSALAEKKKKSNLKKVKAETDVMLDEWGLEFEDDDGNEVNTNEDDEIYRSTSNKSINKDAKRILTRRNSRLVSNKSKSSSINPVIGLMDEKIELESKSSLQDNNLDTAADDAEVSISKVIDREISDHELDLITDRDRIFQTLPEISLSSSSSSIDISCQGSEEIKVDALISKDNSVPIEGEMYDIVLSDVINILQSVN